MAKSVIRTRGAYKTDIHSRHHVWHSDLKEDGGGEDFAPTPEEIILGALGSCMAQTAKLYASRKGWDLQDVDIELSIERFNGKDYDDYDGDELYIHEIQERVVLHGDLTDDQKERIMGIIKKCPVRRIVMTPTFFVETLVEELPEA